MYKFTSTSPAIGVLSFEIPTEENTAALIAGSRWSTQSSSVTFDKTVATHLTYTFPQSSDYYLAAEDYDYLFFGSRKERADDPDLINFMPAGIQFQTALTIILQDYSNISNLEFSLVQDTTYADLTLATTLFTTDELADSGATGELPGYKNHGSEIWLDRSVNNSPPVLGDFEWHTLLHEVGHTMGLTHGHDKLSPEQDSMEFSVMTYRSHKDSDVDTSYRNETNGYAQTLMMYDIAAIQFLYGADFTHNSGGNIYTFSPQTGEMFIDGVGQGRPGDNIIFRTIWDGNGVDTYDLSNYTTNLKIDLAPGGWSTFMDDQRAILDIKVPGIIWDNIHARGNVFNALQYEGDLRSIIENASGGSGNDSIIGNEASNALKGNAGDDVLNGGAGDDFLTGGLGKDTLKGETGKDFVRYDDGDYGNLVIDLLNPTNNKDDLTKKINVVQGDTYSGIDGVLSGNGNDTLWGSKGVNDLFGAGGNDTIHGREGNDYLDGGAGADSLYGGAGADQHLGGNDKGLDLARYDDADHGNLVINLSDPTKNKDDSTRTIKVVEGDTYVGIEGLHGGIGNDNITGLDKSDKGEFLYGGLGHDHIYGLKGNDSLNGGIGADFLYGGEGADVHFGDDGGADGTNRDYARYDDANYGNLVINLFNAKLNTGAAAGDTYSGIEGVIGGVGNDTITGYDALNKVDDLQGGRGNDYIFGLAGDDEINGGAGDDNLYGGLGADSHIGGLGIDNARYDDANHGNLVISLSDPSMNTGAAKGDTYTGVEGLYGGIGNDKITGAANKEYLYGGSGNDQIYGLAGDDNLDGGAGDDQLYGGLGADIHIGDLGIDVARYDDQNYGNLTIRLDKPSANVGAAALGDTYSGIEGLAGGLGNDQIYGNASDNYLYGGAGNDNLFGGDGSDSLYGGLGADTFNGGDGIGLDYVRYDDQNYGNLTIRMDNPSANIGAAAVGDTYNGIEVLVGGLGNDQIFGNDSHNQLYGGAGNDELYGGAGSDNLYGGLGADKFFGGDVSGLDVVRYDDQNHGNLTIRLDIAGANVGAAAKGDTYSGIEGLAGGVGHDVILGDSKDNQLHGGGGNDYLYGQAGNDRLYGDAGADHFVFNEALNATTNVDTIFDFNPIDDTILLTQSIFSKIGNALEATELRLGTAAADANDFVIYDRDTGKLYYDANANGSGGQTLFAQVSIGTLLDTSDFSMLV